MKSLPSLAVLALVTLASCSAPQFSVAPTYGLFEPKGDVSYVTSGGASARNSVETLGLDDSEGTLGARADFKWGVPHLTVSTQASSWDGDGTLTADFGGISAGVNVESELDLALHRAILTFDVLPTDMFELGLGFGITAADIEAEVTDDLSNTTESADEIAPIPLLALRAGFRIWRLDFEALVAGMSIDSGDDKATYLEADLNARLALFGEPGGVNGSLMLGWRQVDIDVEYTDDGDDVALDLTFSGPYFGLQIGI
jgi:hypothetical protein